MDINQPLLCPNCNGTYFEIKREATYLYSYKLDTPLTEGWSTEKEMLPFLFDNREQIDSKEYIQCVECKTKYPCNLEGGDPNIHLTIVQKALRSSFQEFPEFLG
ncbi:MAG: hypothetical protein GX352_03040 [Clostridiales bacterium]|nr:hypothetical protein [Clostridiales bacterium]